MLDNSEESSEQFGLNMKLLDQKETSIEAYINPRLVRKFQPLFYQGVCTFTNHPATRFAINSDITIVQHLANKLFSLGQSKSDKLYSTCYIAELNNVKEKQLQLEKAYLKCYRNIVNSEMIVELTIGTWATHNGLLKFDASQIQLLHQVEKSSKISGKIIQISDSDD
ncbi:hypothetical protein ACET3Z_000867 [Daucus carota]